MEWSHDLLMETTWWPEKEDWNFCPKEIFIFVFELKLSSHISGWSAHGTKALIAKIFTWLKIGSFSNNTLTIDKTFTLHPVSNDPMTIKELNRLVTTIQYIHFVGIKVLTMVSRRLLLYIRGEYANGNAISFFVILKMGSWSACC